MIARQIILTAVVALAPLLAAAAEPEFKPSIVTAARTFERESSTFSVGGIRAGGKAAPISRITVALDGMLVTGEWQPKTLRSTTARDFRRGSEVPAAIERNRLLLRLEDGSVLTAKIVSREKQKARGDVAAN